MSKWKEVRLGEVCEAIYSGGTPKTSIEEYWNGDVKWLTSGETEANYIYDTVQKITRLGVKESATKHVPKNSIVIASAGQGKTRGQVSLILEDMYINQSIIAINSNSEYLINKFLFFNLRSRYEEIRTLSDASSSRGSITTKFIKNIKIKIPDLETQEKIAQVLSSYDELIENNNRRIELLERMAEEIYKEWFVRMRFPGHEKVRFEKGIPEGWEVKRVKDVVDRLKAGHYYKEHEVSEVGDTIVIDQSEKTFLGFHGNGPDHIADIDSPIILFGDHSCKMNLMIRNFSVSENVVPFKSVEKNNEIFLFYATKRLIETQEYKRHWTEFTNKKIFIPSDILKLKFINNVRDTIIQVEKYKEQNQNLIKQRDMLLPRLMNGTIEVK